MLVGAPKSLDDIPPFCVEEMVHMEETVLGLLQATRGDLSGSAAIPLGTFAQVARTLRDLRAVVGQAALLRARFEPEELTVLSANEQAALAVGLAAERLLATPPPPLPTIAPANTPFKK